MAKRKKSNVDETLIDVVEVKEQAQDYFEKHKNLILAVVAAILIGGGGYIVYKFLLQAPKERQAEMAIFKAEQQFQRDSFALALENPGGGYEGFLDIIENYSGTETSNLAKLYAGISYMNVGRYDDAIDYLESYSASGTYGPILKNGNLGDAYSELQDFDKAIGFYKKATSADADALLTPYYLYKLGLLSERMGQGDTAKSAFERIKNEFPDSEESRNAAKLLANL